MILEPQLSPGRYRVWLERDGGWYLDVDEEGGADGAHAARWAPPPAGSVSKAPPDAPIEPYNDIAMSEATYRAGVSEYLANQSVPLEGLEYTLKARPAPVRCTSGPCSAR